MTIGNKLKQLRKGKSFKLKDVSQLIDLSISYISDIERERTSPSLKTLEKLALLYKLSLAELFTEVDNSLRAEGKYIVHGI